MPLKRLELLRLSAQVSKTCMSTNSITGAFWQEWRDSNPRKMSESKSDVLSLFTTLLFICYFLLKLLKWCLQKDLNLRTRKRTVLQTVGFNHSPIQAYMVGRERFELSNRNGTVLQTACFEPLAYLPIY